MAEIAFEEVSKIYNPGLFKKKVQAVKELTFQVERGEVFGLIGPNGAGKSTAIRLLLGLIRPDSGSIRFQGQPLAQADLQAHIGYLPENPYLYDHLNLDELLAFCGRSSGLTAAQAGARADELTCKLGLEAARRRPLRTFSKGMLQRAGICFSLLHDPGVVILDEPMSGLDPIGRKMVFDLVLELKGRGKTVFFCSHILSDVERLCDRIGLMVAGRVVREFGPEDFRQSAAGSIYLVVPSLSQEGLLELEALLEGVSRQGDTMVLAVSSQQVGTLAERLSSLGVDILGSRKEAFSLESLFMQTVEEQAS